MKHLSVDEMIDFVSLTDLSENALMLSAAVTGHIRQCEKCLKRVQAFQLIHDEFIRMKASGDFKTYIHTKAETGRRLAAACAEPASQDELEGY